MDWCFFCFGCAIPVSDQRVRVINTNECVSISWTFWLSFIHQNLTFDVIKTCLHLVEISSDSIATKFVFFSSIIYSNSLCIFKKKNGESTTEHWIEALRSQWKMWQKSRLIKEINYWKRGRRRHVSKILSDSLEKNCAKIQFVFFFSVICLLKNSQKKRSDESGAEGWTSIVCETVSRSRFT